MAIGLLGVALTALFACCVAIDPRDFAKYDAMFSVNMRQKANGKWRMAEKDESFRWRDATIPYQIAPMAFDQKEMRELREAMDIYENETCLTFRQARESDPYSVIIRDGGWGCNAILGQAGTKGAQTVNLASGCRFYGLFLHELGHTIGLHHEHQHPDRDQGVYIHMDNVSPDMREWFETIDRNKLNMYGVDYDIQSIMHYGQHAFASRGSDGKSKITIQARDWRQQKYLMYVYMKDLSFGDAKRINLMYKCNKHCPNVSCSGGFVNKHCRCETPAAFAKRRCVNRYSDATCEGRKKECETENTTVMYEMFVNCRKTCQRCYEA